MSENPPETPNLRLLAINLILLLACISGLVLVIFLYPRLLRPAAPSNPTTTQTLRPSFTPSQTSTSSLTPTITRTPLPSHTPTLSLTPSITPTPTQTVPTAALPTLTPARAYADTSAYELSEWTAEDADYAARLLQGYPDTLPLTAPPGEITQAYLDAYRYPVFAWREALLRFPEAPQADPWPWQLAYDLALMGDDQAAQSYADLIAGGLNRDETQIPYLYSWFAVREPRLGLYMTAIDPPAGYVGSYVIELRGEGGSAFIWLLEKPGAYQAYPLLARFDFIHQPRANWIVADLNPDDADGSEVAIYFTQEKDQFDLNPPRAFNLSKSEPVELPFIPDEAIFRVGVEFDNYWSVSAGPEGPGDLVFKTTVFPSCPVTLRRTYRWNGTRFAFVDQRVNVEPNPDRIADCEAVIDHVATVWGPEAAIPLMQTLLPDWPPSSNSQGTPYPSDAKDEWRYRLGVYHALVGNQILAVEYLNQVSTNPSVYNSSWIVPAQEFLATYQTPQDLYLACTGSPVCDPGLAIQKLVGDLPAEADVFESLTQAGMNPNSSGFFDFDDDEESERWFTTRYRERQTSEFWILVKDKTGHTAVRVGPVQEIPPSLEYLEEAYIADDGLTLQPAVFLNGEQAFAMQRLPDTQEPYLLDVPLREEYPSPFFVPLADLERRLLSGESPKQIQKELLELKKYPGLLCASTWTCDSYYYLLGLSSELAGDTKTALDNYLTLWLNYSKSPFTTLARLKLEGTGPVYTPTLSPTPTLTITPSLTPTLTGTPSPSVTPTPTFTLTGTHSATPTVTGTPPTATPTRTPRPATAGPTSTATATVDPYWQPTPYE
jgi:hypothetical protein